MATKKKIEAQKPPATEKVGELDPNRASAPTPDVVAQVDLSGSATPPPLPPKPDDGQSPEPTKRPRGRPRKDGSTPAGTPPGEAAPRARKGKQPIPRVIVDDIIMAVPYGLSTAVKYATGPKPGQPPFPAVDLAAQYDPSVEKMVKDAAYAYCEEKGWAFGNGTAAIVGIVYMTAKAVPAAMMEHRRAMSEFMATYGNGPVAVPNPPPAQATPANPPDMVPTNG